MERAIIEDYKEMTPCGGKVRYSVDTRTDMVTWSDFYIETVGQNCKRCSWRAICWKGKKIPPAVEAWIDGKESDPGPEDKPEWHELVQLGKESVDEARRLKADDTSNPEVAKRYLSACETIDALGKVAARCFGVGYDDYMEIVHE